nr:unnamed protein product [Digitaria exilis]
MAQLFSSSSCVPRRPSPSSFSPTPRTPALLISPPLRCGARRRAVTAAASLHLGPGEIAELARNKVLIAATVASAIGQLSKPFTSGRNGGAGAGLDLKTVFRSGGMPSTHSASVVAVATSLGLERGFADSVFGMSVVFAAIVMYDAQMSGDDRSKGPEIPKPPPSLEEIAGPLLPIQDRLDALTLRVDALERPPVSTPATLPQGFPYGMPGYGTTTFSSSSSSAGALSSGAASTMASVSTTAPLRITNIPMHWSVQCALWSTMSCHYLKHEFQGYMPVVWLFPCFIVCSGVDSLDQCLLVPCLIFVKYTFINLGVRREVGNHAKVLNKFWVLREKVPQDSDVDMASEFISVTEEVVSSSHSSASPSPRRSSMNESPLLKGLRSSEPEIADLTELNSSYIEKGYQLSESVGHTELQVTVGALLGFIVSLAVYATL